MFGPAHCRGGDPVITADIHPSLPIIWHPGTEGFFKPLSPLKDLNHSHLCTVGSFLVVAFYFLLVRLSVGALVVRLAACVRRTVSAASASITQT